MIWSRTFFFLLGREGGSLSQPRLNIFAGGNMRVMICLGQGGLRSRIASSILLLTSRLPTAVIVKHNNLRQLIFYCRPKSHSNGMTILHTGILHFSSQNLISQFLREFFHNCFILVVLIYCFHGHLLQGIWLQHHRNYKY